MSKRLFIGTFIAHSLFEFIYKEIQEDFARASSGKWVELENLHFTYFFLGDTDEVGIQNFESLLSGLCKEYDSELVLKGLGAFPNPKRPRVLFINVYNPGNELFIAQKNIEKELKSLGFKPEEREFTAHATLQRVKSYEQPEFLNAIEKYKDFKFGIMPGFKIDLIESRLTPKGPIYSPLL